MWYFFVFQFPIAVPYGGSGSALDRFYLFSWFAGFTRFSLMSSSSILAGTRYICIYINKLTRDEPRKQQHAGKQGVTPPKRGNTTETRHARKQGVTSPKRGSSLPNYLDQTQSRGQGSLDKRREKIM